MMPFNKIITAVLLAALFASAGCSSIGLAPKIPKEVEKSSADIEQARLLKKIEKNFQDPQLHYDLGVIYQQQGRWAEADTQFKTALNFDPVHRKAQAARVKTLQSCGDKQKADMLTEIYIEQTSVSAASSLRLGMAFQKQNLDDLALKCYEQALNLAPNSARVHKQIGYFYLSKANKDKAKDYLLRSFQLNQDQPDVAAELGRLDVQITRHKTESNTKQLDKIDEEENRSKTP